MMKLTLTTAIAILALVSTGWTAQKDVKTTPVLTTDSAELEWMPVDILPPGAKFAVLTSAGDWSVVRVKFPPYYLMPPHTHPNAEAIWLVSGSVIFGFGEKVDKAQPFLKPGAFVALAPGEGGKHWLWTGDEGAILDVQVSDPGGIDYVNPADDPKHKHSN
jgi:quercetin dioxygenase-like cupin family protein